MALIEQLKTWFHNFGSSTGAYRGPRPGDGAVIHFSSGNADFDGLPGNALPPRKYGIEDQLCVKSSPVN